MNLCILIPVYNHEEALSQVLDKLSDYGLPCILVDDGSHEVCQQAIMQESQARSWVESIRLDVNQGKGGAVMAGLRHAFNCGYSHALQIDADGQHNTEDLPRFVDAANGNPQALVIGQAVYDDSVPKSRLYGRYITHFWVWVETLSFAVRDSMCGFRVYPLSSTLDVIDHVSMGLRMDFDPEIVVRLHWEGLEIINLPTEVKYPLDGISHFDTFQDNVKISLMHSKLFFSMLARFPFLIVRRLAKRGVRFG